MISGLSLDQDPEPGLLSLTLSVGQIGGHLWPPPVGPPLAGGHLGDPTPGWTPPSGSRWPSCQLRLQLVSLSVQLVLALWAGLHRGRGYTEPSHHVTPGAHLDLLPQPLLGSLLNGPDDAVGLHPLVIPVRDTPVSVGEAPPPAAG